GEARSALDQALRLDPSDQSARMFRGLVAEADKDLPGALAQYDELIQRNPRRADNHFFRGSVLLNLKGYDLAVRDLNRVIQLVPLDTEAWSNKADALRLWGKDLDQPRRMQKGLVTIDSAIAKDGGNAVAHSIKGAILSELGRFEAATEALEKALKLDST